MNDLFFKFKKGVGEKYTDLFFYFKWIFIAVLIMVNVNDAKSQVYNSPTYARKSNPHIEIVRIQITNKYTIVEFLHTNPFETGGWAHITPTTFIRIPKTTEKLQLIKATGIPTAPERHDYKKKGEQLRFRLYFPPVNPSTEYLDIIELEGADIYKAFNFYRVELTPIA